MRWGLKLQFYSNPFSIFTVYGQGYASVLLELLLNLAELQGKGLCLPKLVGIIPVRVAVLT